MPKVTGLLESCLYVEDVHKAADFYTGLFGFPILFISDRAAALNVMDKQVLLLFRKQGSLTPITRDRGTIPPHDGDGQLHFAFAIAAEELDAWENTLRAEGIDVEARYHWELGGHSIYFRDLDGHLVELVTPGCWEI